MSRIFVFMLRWPIFLTSSIVHIRILFVLPLAGFQRAGPTDPDEELYDDDLDEVLIESAIAAYQQDTSAAHTSFTPNQVDESPSENQVKLNYVR